jgi:hypothetical protein
MIKIAYNEIVLYILFTSFPKKGFVDTCSCLMFSIFIKSLKTSLEELFVIDPSPSSVNEKS